MDSKEDARPSSILGDGTNVGGNLDVRRGSSPSRGSGSPLRGSGSPLRGSGQAAQPAKTRARRPKSPDAHWGTDVAHLEAALEEERAARVHQENLILKCGAELCDLRGAHAALEDRLDRAEDILNGKGSASKGCTPPSALDDCITPPRIDVSIPQAAERLRNLEGEVASLRSSISSCEEAVVFAVKDAQERDSAVAAVRAAVEGLQTVEALTGQQQKQILDLAGAIKAMRATITSLGPHSEFTHAESAHVLTSMDAASPPLASSPFLPLGSHSALRFTSGNLIGRATSSSMMAAGTPGTPAIARSSLSSSQPHSWTSNFDPVRRARERDCEGNSVLASAAFAHYPYDACASQGMTFGTSHAGAGYLSQRHRMSPIQSPRMDSVPRSPPPPVARTLSPSVPYSRTQATGAAHSNGLHARHLCGAAQGHVMIQTLGGGCGSVRYS